MIQIQNAGKGQRKSQRDHNGVDVRCRREYAPYARNIVGVLRCIHPALGPILMVFAKVITPPYVGACICKAKQIAVGEGNV